MNQDYIKPDVWSIIEEGFDPQNVKSSESIFSIGNGAMGQRANFEEDYSGATFQGSYIGGVYYPDKTRVGWWKNGYPEYFAKVLNAANWTGIKIEIDGELLDLNKCEVTDFERILNMKAGFLERSFKATLVSGKIVKVQAKRFCSIADDECAATRRRRLLPAPGRREGPGQVGRALRAPASPAPGTARIPEAPEGGQPGTAWHRKDAGAGPAGGTAGADAHAARVPDDAGRVRVQPPDDSLALPQR